MQRQAEEYQTEIKALKFMVQLKENKILKLQVNYLSSVPQLAFAITFFHFEVKVKVKFRDEYGPKITFFTNFIFYFLLEPGGNRGIWLPPSVNV